MRAGCSVKNAARAAAALVCAAAVSSCIVEVDDTDGKDGIVITYVPGSGAAGQYPHEFIEDYRAMGLEHYWLPTAGGTAAIAHKQGWLLSYWQGDDGLKYQAGHDVIDLAYSLVLTGVWCEGRSGIPGEVQGSWVEAGEGSGTWIFTADSVSVPIEPVAGSVFSAHCIGPVIYAENDDLAFTLGLYELSGDGSLSIRLNDHSFRAPIEGDELPVPPEWVTLRRPQ